MQKTLTDNRKARFEYEFLKSYQAGLVLLGHEVKSLKQGGGEFAGSYIEIVKGEAWLLNFHIKPYAYAQNVECEPKRKKKLLLSRKEIRTLERDLATQGMTIVPVRCGLERGFVKVDIALARGKKAYDKRQTIKDRDNKRRIQQDIYAS
jgi:SsrA-binding protein